MLENKGDIDARYKYVPSKSNFGQQFEFHPTEGQINVGEYQAIQVLLVYNNTILFRRAIPDILFLSHFELKSDTIKGSKSRI